jgi:hypothetical protein
MELMKKMLVAFSAALMVSTAAILADQPVNDLTLQINPTSIAAGGSALVTVTINPNDGAIDCGKGKIQYLLPPTPDPDDVDPGWEDLGGDLAVTNNQFSATFDSSVIPVTPGTSVQFRGGYAATGPNCDFPAQAPGLSPTLSLAITGSECEAPLSIAADQASGNGNPPAGYEGDWTFEIIVTACEHVTGVTAQGGTSGWTDFTATDWDPTKGTAAVRNQNKKTTILLWTIGEMAAGESQTLEVTVHGTIKNNTPSGTELFLSGPWSATFTDDENVKQKSSYTGRVSIVVQ